MGGKKKDSKGLFGNRKSGLNRPIHQNVAQGDQLNKGLEDQYNKAYGFHHQGKYNRGFQNWKLSK